MRMIGSFSRVALVRKRDVSVRHVSGECAKTSSPDIICLRLLQSYERSTQIPLGLLTAISYVEAGRPGMDGKPTAWPWTINVGGQSRFFDTKEEAVTETQKLLDDGTRSIDVGCMQINLRYHPTAFHSLDEAFDPAMNVAYGAPNS